MFHYRTAVRLVPLSLSLDFLASVTQRLDFVDAMSIVFVRDNTVKTVRNLLQPFIS